MELLLALIPAICWGSIIFLNVKLGGDAFSQLLGTAFGAIIFSIGVFFVTSPSLTPTIWMVGIISGMFWAIGQRNQLASVKYLGVSRTVPLSTGMQLISTALVGVIIFKEWSQWTTILIGTVSILFIIIGVVFTVLEDKNKSSEKNGKNNKKGFLTLLLSTLGYLIYVIIIRWYKIDGWSAIMPQSIGIVISSIVLTYQHKPFNKYAARNIIAGIWWGIGNLGLLLSLPKIGVATSYSLSQTGIIISTLGGVFFLGEKKSKKQVIFVIVGCILIIIGGVLLGFTKK
ncbi:GRP family sugar transporter [Bacillus sp. 03113]|uniref:GRP family sugar transporter n=1 Tax=Bacillus sp. 03113 TaxID=2578211 RepID=UPI001141FFC0|nr:GRP family sugar transporter [Bacillus sp. 03113]